MEAFSPEKANSLLDSEEEGKDYLLETKNRPFIKRISGDRYELINENTLKRVWKFEEHEQN